MPTAPRSGADAYGSPVRSRCLRLPRQEPMMDRDAAEEALAERGIRDAGRPLVDAAAGARDLDAGVADAADAGKGAGADEPDVGLGLGAAVGVEERDRVAGDAERVVGV